SDENSIHSSEGIGDGIWSVFTIIDAIYDATEKSVVVIDEPELSLHPMYQKKVLELLLEASKTKQIIISTHSPYFISWNALKNGGMLYRTYKKENNICVCSLKE
ncbi:AAA family ATPase, partial [Streptococcus pasteurianus]